MNGKLDNESFRYTGFYRGKVIDNADPSQLGRVKILVYGVFTTAMPTAQIPWAVPAAALFAGSGSGFGSFAVPEVDSQLFVFFEGEDFNQPVYFAEAPTGVHGLPTERITNYPNRKVLKTKNGIVFYIDDTSGSQEIKVTHPGGASLTINDSGDISIAGNNITITGTTVNVNP